MQGCATKRRPDKLSPSLNSWPAGGRGAAQNRRRGHAPWCTCSLPDRRRSCQAGTPPCARVRSLRGCGERGVGGSRCLRPPSSGELLVLLGVHDGVGGQGLLHVARVPVVVKAVREVPLHRFLEPHVPAGLLLPACRKGLGSGSITSQGPALPASCEHGLDELCSHAGTCVWPCRIAARTTMPADGARPGGTACRRRCSTAGR